jgi:hypothetical protein
MALLRQEARVVERFRIIEVAEAESLTEGGSMPGAAKHCYPQTQQTEQRTPHLTSSSPAWDGHTGSCRLTRNQARPEEEAGMRLRFTAGSSGTGPRRCSHSRGGWSILSRASTVVLAGVSRRAGVTRTGIGQARGGVLTKLDRSPGPREKSGTRVCRGGDGRDICGARAVPIEGVQW